MAAATHHCSSPSTAPDTPAGAPPGPRRSPPLSSALQLLQALRTRPHLPCLHSVLPAPGPARWPLSSVRDLQPRTMSNGTDLRCSRPAVITLLQRPHLHLQVSLVAVDEIIHGRGHHQRLLPQQGHVAWIGFSASSRSTRRPFRANALSPACPASLLSSFTGSCSSPPLSGATAAVAGAAAAGPGPAPEAPLRNGPQQHSTIASNTATTGTINSRITSRNPSTPSTRARIIASSIGPLHWLVVVIRQVIPHSSFPHGRGDLGAYSSRSPGVTRGKSHSLGVAIGITTASHNTPIPHPTNAPRHSPNTDTRANFILCTRVRPRTSLSIRSCPIAFPLFGITGSSGTLLLLNSPFSCHCTQFLHSVIGPALTGKWLVGGSSPAFTPACHHPCRTLRTHRWNCKPLGCTCLCACN
jgi:hypothetical protein